MLIMVGRPTLVVDVTISRGPKPKRSKKESCMSSIHMVLFLDYGDHVTSFLRLLPA